LDQVTDYISNCSVMTITNGQRLQRQEPRIPHRY
jgi:hypothetical protein